MWGCGVKAVLIWCCFVKHNYLLRLWGLKKCIFKKIIPKHFRGRSSKCTKIKHTQNLSHALANLSELQRGNCYGSKWPSSKTTQSYLQYDSVITKTKMRAGSSKLPVIQVWTLVSKCLWWQEGQLAELFLAEKGWGVGKALTLLLAYLWLDAFTDNFQPLINISSESCTASSS